MKLRVLVFDDRLWLTADDEMRLAAAGLEFETTVAVDGANKYHPDTRSLAWATLAAEGEWDAVVVGNNLTAGPIIAAALPAAVHDRTIIVWNEYRPGQEERYAALGFTHFGIRVARRDDPHLTIAGFLLEAASQKAG